MSKSIPLQAVGNEENRFQLRVRKPTLVRRQTATRQSQMSNRLEEWKAEEGIGG